MIVPAITGVNGNGTGLPGNSDTILTAGTIAVIKPSTNVIATDSTGDLLKKLFSQNTFFCVLHRDILPPGQFRVRGEIIGGELQIMIVLRDRDLVLTSAQFLITEVSARIGFVDVLTDEGAFLCSDSPGLPVEDTFHIIHEMILVFL